MSRRKDRARTPGLWVATNALPRTGGHPFYQRLNQVLDQHGFDAFVEAQCATFYAPIGRERGRVIGRGAWSNRCSSAWPRASMAGV